MKIDLEGEMETLLIPLYGKAKMSEDGIFRDTFAQRAVTRLNFDFSKLKIQKKTQVMLAFRAEYMDLYAKEFLGRHDESIVLHLGCGLDSRYFRLGKPKALWYELDFPEVIEIKRQLYPPERGYSYIPSTVNDHSWLDSVSWKGESILIIAEGLFMYLTEKEIRELMNVLKDRFGSYTMIFDVVSSLTVKYSKHHPSIKRTGAHLLWGIDNPKNMEEYLDGAKYLRTIYMTENPNIRKLSPYYRMMYRLADIFKPAKNAHKIVIMEIT
ncbi:class I SAM-dependent methyltransferase [Gudongella sp. SC589]|uniref:class I SAM-dependent methyltransferase n=1 Tax=Gudongella sp. SC589 TaxID=3385990 RepID=UPI00390497D6